ncbi:MAG: macro domain-containing protein [Deltaproteobacteria bacterium]|nr:macro domain-containing protein [Deltaproteobacteria bacterium]
MIYEVTGDILLSKAQLIVHGVAPHDHFTNGLALALRERWPSMVKDFRHYCHNQNPKTGDAWLWGGPQIRIANLLTQEPSEKEGGLPGKASLSSIRHSLDKLKKMIEDEKFTSVYLPKIATGVLWLNWSDLNPIIYEKLGVLNIQLIIYAQFTAREAAKESL